MKHTLIYAHKIRTGRWKRVSVQCTCGWRWVFGYQNLALPRLHHARHLSFSEYRPLHRPWRSDS